MLQMTKNSTWNVYGSMLRKVQLTVTSESGGPSRTLPSSYVSDFKSACALCLYFPDFRLSFLSLYLHASFCSASNL